MDSVIKIDNYISGYNSSHTTCIDIPIAAAAGSYGYDNYFLYSALYGYFVNWMPVTPWLTQKKNILSILGLCFNEINSDKEKFLSDVRAELDKGRPVALIVKYGALFYSKYYGWGDYNHAVLVDSYDTKCGTFQIRDRELIREHIESGLMTGDALQKLQITESMLQSIWEKSNFLFREESSHHCQTIYSIGSNTDHEVVFDKGIFFSKILENNPINENRFSDCIHNILSGDMDCPSFNFENIRRKHHRSLICFFNYIVAHIESVKSSGSSIDNMKRLMENSLKIRSEILSKVHLYFLRKEKVSTVVIDNFSDDIFNSDSAFFSELRFLMKNEKC